MPKCCLQSPKGGRAYGLHKSGILLCMKGCLTVVQGVGGTTQASDQVCCRALQRPASSKRGTVAAA
jgi:hypothetical protein